MKLPSLTGRSESAPVRDENADGRIDERDATIAQRRTTDGSAADADHDRPTGGGARSRIAAAFGSARASSSRPAATTGDAPVVVPDRADETTTYRSRTATDDTAAVKTADRPTAPEPVRADQPARTTEPATKAQSPTKAQPATEPATKAQPATELDRPRHAHPDVEDEPRVATPPPGPRPRASVLATLGLVVGVAAALFVLSGTLAGYGIGLGVLALLLSVGGISATSRRHVAGKSDALFGLLLGVGAVVVGALAMTGQFSWPSTDGGTVEQFRQWLDSQSVDRF
nr:thrombospondin [Micromonospora sp. DSM 115978]